MGWEKDKNSLANSKKELELPKRQFMKKVEELAKSNPEQKIKVIVKLDKGLPEATSELKDLGIEIRHEYKLINAFSAEITMDQAIWLERKSWVIRIEEDKEVYIS